MFPNLDVERRLQALERFMREIRGDRGAVEAATWTPTWTNLTVAGSPTYAGYYTRIGRLVFWTVIIIAGGANTTASSANSTHINNLPFTANHHGICYAVNSSNTISFGNGTISGSSTSAYTPTWAATSDHIVISGWYEI